MYFMLYHIPLNYSLLYEAQKLLLDGGMTEEVVFIKQRMKSENSMLKFVYLLF